MTVRSVYLRSLKFRQLVKRELDKRDRYPLSARRRAWLWRRGFLSESAYIYDLDGGTHHQYLSDYERFVRTPFINGEWNVALSNKLVFHWLMSRFDDHRVEVYGMVRDDQYVPFDDGTGPQPDHVPGSTEPSLRPDGDAGSGHSDIGSGHSGTGSGHSGTGSGHSDTDSGHNGLFATEVNADCSVTDPSRRVRDRLDEEGKLVLKWIKGGGGENVYRCRRTEDGYQVNGEQMTAAGFESLVDELEEYLVTAYVDQSSFCETLYPDTTNTIRLLTMYDDRDDEVFVPIAILRVGTDVSAPLDNFGQGGLSVEIDVETGELGRAVQIQTDPAVGDRPELNRLDRHPSTSTPIEGTTIPAWPRIRDRMTHIAAANQQLPYVGWDLIPTDAEGGFAVIEGNSYPGMKSLQSHRPLLEDDRVRSFFRRHDVLRR